MPFRRVHHKGEGTADPRPVTDRQGTAALCIVGVFSGKADAQPHPSIRLLCKSDVGTAGQPLDLLRGKAQLFQGGGQGVLRLDTGQLPFVQPDGRAAGFDVIIPHDRDRHQAGVGFLIVPVGHEIVVVAGQGDPQIRVVGKVAHLVVRQHRQKALHAGLCRRDAVQAHAGEDGGRIQMGGGRFQKFIAARFRDHQLLQPGLQLGQGRVLRVEGQGLVQHALGGFIVLLLDVHLHHACPGRCAAVQAAGRLIIGQGLIDHAQGQVGFGPLQVAFRPVRVHGDGVGKGCQRLVKAALGQVAHTQVVLLLPALRRAGAARQQGQRQQQAQDFSFHGSSLLFSRGGVQTPAFFQYSASRESPARTKNDPNRVKTAKRSFLGRCGDFFRRFSPDMVY